MRIEVESLCNQCKQLVFGVPGCKKGAKTPEGKPQMKNIPTTFASAEGFVHIFKPEWCPGKEVFKKDDKKGA